VGTVEMAVRAAISEGMVLQTPARSAPFVVDLIDENGIVLLFGEKRTPTRVTWECLEGIPFLLRGRGWLSIGTRFDVEADVGTLDEYLKQSINRGTAAWVASLLEAAGLVRIDRRRPARLSLVER
jgi:hypothetical protein